MKELSFAQRWTGSPLITAPAAVLDRSILPADCKEFLRTVGLPSNALWFDLSTAGIMCFDSIACIRELGETDLSAESRAAVSGMGCLAILGVYLTSFIVADEQGRMWTIGTGGGQNFRRRIHPAMHDPGWRASTFVNQSPMQFAECLLALQAMEAVFAREGYDFNAPAIRAAVGEFRRAIEAADADALGSIDDYWFMMLDDVDVW